MNKNIFNSIKLTKPKSNTFDLTHDVKMSGKMGNLMPVLTMPCVPGDKVQLAADSLVRFAPLIAPVMHRMDVTIHYFFTPNRILWDNWEKFIVNEETGGLPHTQLGALATADQQKFADYMGIAPSSGIQGGITDTKVSLLPFAAYQTIYNEYYRDQNLVDPVFTELVDGQNPIGEFFDMQKRAWEHDYFSSALPFAQAGDPVDIPLGEIQVKDDTIGGPHNPNFKTTATGNVVGGTVQSTTTTNSVVIGGNPQYYDPDGSLEVAPSTITDLRRAVKLQEWLEKSARAGRRYVESIKSHFGVNSKDARLQRPEYMTGTKAPIVVSEVLNTTGESSGLPQGNMAGHAVSVGHGNAATYTATEHGYIMGIMSVTPKPAYQQGIPRDFEKLDPLDFYWPAFAHIGEQPIYTNEIYGYQADPKEVFGYTPRYAEYKYMPNRVAGDFRTTLDYWHLGRIFANKPELNQEFIEIDPEDVNRIFAVNDDEDNLYITILNKVKAHRPMPVFGTPMI